jgi:hypothetical protein
VLDLVVVRVPVPPATIGTGTLRDIGIAPGGFRLERFGLLDDGLPSRTLPFNPSRQSA